MGKRKEGGREKKPLRSNELIAECPEGAAAPPQHGHLKGGFSQLAEGTLLNYFELTDCNSSAPVRAGQLGPRSALPFPSLPFPRTGTDRRTDGRCASWVPLPCRQQGGTGRCCQPRQCPQFMLYREKHLGVGWEGRQRILPQLRPINISYSWKKNDYIPASTFLVYFKCVTAFHFLPRLCFL